MSITRKAFEKGSFKQRPVSDPKNHKIMVFLRKNKSRAYKVDEIAKLTKMNKYSVRSMLRTLMKKNLILHKSPYYTIK